MIIVGWTLNPDSPSDRNKPAVKQYLRELKAAKQSTGAFNRQLTGWPPGASCTRSPTR